MSKHPVDELADVRAALDELKEREYALRQRIAKANDRCGDEWVATVSAFSRERLDILAARSALGAKLDPFLLKHTATTIRLRSKRQTDGWAPDWRRLRRERPVPEKVRQAVPKRADGHCEFCAADEPLELHHRTYGNKADLIFGRETPQDLWALCRYCHQSRHAGPAGEYFLDPGECAVAWDRFGSSRDT
jgi:hypothetical protein